MRSPARRLLLAAVVLSALAGLTGVAVFVVGSNPPGPVVEMPLADIDEGVTPVVVNGTGVILVREGDAVIAFSAATIRTARMGDQLHYCTQAELFIESSGYSTFGLDGTKSGGPAPRNLDRFETTIRDDTLALNLDEVIIGAAPDGTPAQDQTPYRLRAGQEWVETFNDPLGCPLEAPQPQVG